MSILPLDAKTSFFIVQNSVFDILQFKLCTVHLSIKIFNFGEVATVPTLTVFHRHMLLFTHVRCYPSAPVAFFSDIHVWKKMCEYAVQLWCALKLCATSENNAQKWNMQFTSIYKMYIHNLNCKISKTELWTMKNDVFASRGKIDFSSPI
jgi:hypothetical protein